MIKMLSDVAIWERAVKGKIYPAGCSYIILSAISGPLQKVGYLAEDSEVESRYAVIMPKPGINGRFLYIALEYSVERFLAKYQTTINLQENTLNYFELEWVESEADQRIMANACMMLDKQIRDEQEFIEKQMDKKRILLDKLFV